MGYCGGDGTTGSVGLGVEEFETVWEGEDGEEVGVGGYGGGRRESKLFWVDGECESGLKSDTS